MIAVRIERSLSGGAYCPGELGVILYQHVHDGNRVCWRLVATRRPLGPVEHELAIRADSPREALTILTDHLWGWPTETLGLATQCVLAQEQGEGACEEAQS